MPEPNLSLSRRIEALSNKSTEIIMRKILGLMLLVLTSSATAPAFANTNANCNQVSKAEWAQCVIDEAASHDSQ